jgi:hypothetical protein
MLWNSKILSSTKHWLLQCNCYERYLWWSDRWNCSARLRYKQTKQQDIRGVSKKFSEWYQKTNNTEDTNKLTLLSFKIIVILHNTLLETFIKLLETVSKSSSLVIDRTTAVTRSWITTTSAKREPFIMLFRRGNINKSTVLPWSGARRHQIRGVRWVDFLRNYERK